MSKRIYVFIMLVLIPSIGYSQARRYLMSDTLPSIQIYTFLTEEGYRTPIKRVIEITYVGSTLVINEVNSMNQQTTGVHIQYLSFTKDEVLVKYSRISNALGTNSRRNFTPPAILLRVPKGSETVSWFNKEDGQRYTAKFVTLKDAGETVRKLLAVYNRYEDGQIVHYYLAGFGLWETALIKNGKTTTLYRLGY